MNKKYYYRKDFNNKTIFVNNLTNTSGLRSKKRKNQ